MLGDIYVVIINNATYMSDIKSVENAEEAASILAEYLGRDFTVYIFEGYRWHISKGANKRLIPPHTGQAPIYICDPPNNTCEIDPTGNMSESIFDD